MIILTGGAGFIGSCLLRTLNDRGYRDILIVDNIGTTEKWKHLRGKQYREYLPKSELLSQLPTLSDVTAVIHLGAQSSTTERDFDYLWRNNFAYTRSLWQFCAQRHIPFLYASSAATYGDGSLGFDDRSDLDRLLPLNGYGYSKQVFDQWVKHQATVFPPQHVGLKFFNVYGPNEDCKGSMASMVYHGFHQIQQTGTVRLFRSCRREYPDGGQLRDFVYVKDVCQVICWFLDHPQISGLFNVGTGQARSFRELAEATFRAMGREPNITYIDMPDHLQKAYQYYTQAEIGALRQAGYTAPFHTLEEGITDYVQNHLMKEQLY